MRHSDWPSRLYAAIKARQRTPFAYGRHDCCLAACDLVAAMTGIDLAEGLRGYRSREEAEALITSNGGSVQAMTGRACAEHGFPEVPPEAAQRGDLVLVDYEGAPALGIVDEPGVRVAGYVGWAVLPRNIVRAAWRVE